MPPTHNDAELVSQACQGNKRSFERLVDRHLPTLLGFFRYLGVPESQVDDLAQETFLKVLRSLSRFNPEKSFITWLTSIGRNVFIDEWRKTPKLLPLEIDEDVLQQAVDESVENRLFVKGIIDRLPDEARFLLELRFYQDLPFPQMAEVTGESEGTLRVKIHRILKRLRVLGREEKQDAPA